MNFSESELELPEASAFEGRPEYGTEKFISFELGGRLCCVAASGVAEVIQPMPVSPLPNAPDWLLGLIAHRGDPVAVIDSSIIAKPALENRGKAKVIIFRPRPGENQFALPIDSLHEVVLAPAKENRPREFFHKGVPLAFIEHNQLFDSFDGGTR